jgi:hypothetical protein
MAAGSARTPLTVWFTACWQFAAAKDGISALSLQRSLEISSTREIGSHQTAWAMLHGCARCWSAPAGSG